MGLFSRVLHRETTSKSHSSSHSKGTTILQIPQIKNVPDTTSKSFVVGNVSKAPNTSGIIQKQLGGMNRGISVNYEEIENLKTENNMLHEQVAQQKSFIQRLTTELDVEKKDTLQMKQKNLQLEKDLANATRSDLRDSQSSSETNNTSLLLRNTPETSVSTTPDSYDSKQQPQQQPQQTTKHASQIFAGQNHTQAIPLTKEMNTTILHTQKSVLIESQRQTIEQLKKRVAELEIQAKESMVERERSLDMLNTSMLAIKANKNFIGSSSSLISESETFPEPTRSLYTTNLPQYCDHDGTTYVIESFKPF